MNQQLSSWKTIKGAGVSKLNNCGISAQVDPVAATKVDSRPLSRYKVRCSGKQVVHYAAYLENMKRGQGVRWNQRKRMWEALVTGVGKPTSVGCFVDEEVDGRLLLALFFLNMSLIYILL